MGVGGRTVQPILTCLILLVSVQPCLSLLPGGIGSGAGSGACDNGEALNGNNINTSGKWRIFNQLSKQELNEVLDFLVEELGFVYAARSSSGPTPTTAGPNIVQRVELLYPAKAEVLSYMDDDGTKPQRFAKATIVRSAHTPKDVMEYKIGPLPLAVGAKKASAEVGVNGDDSPVTGVVMQKLRQDGEIPFYKRPTEGVSAGWTAAVVFRTAYQLRQIYKDTVGVCYGFDSSSEESEIQSAGECGFGLIEWLPFPALDPDTSKRIMSIQWFFRTRRGGGDEMNYHSIPISFKVDEEDEDEANWRTFDFEYCHQGPFDTAESLLAAYNNGELVKCVADDWKDPNYDESWSKTSDRDRIRKGAEKASPRSFYPNGVRFQTKVDSKDSGSGFKFEYFGWEGHASIRYGTGIVFHDIRFRGNRIVYELALQDQFVAYSGYAGGGQTIYMDSFFGIGLNSLPLKRGVDCPETAQFFPMTKMTLQGTFEEARNVVAKTGLIVGSVDKLPDVVCVFEEDGQTPEWRHTHFNGTNGPHTDSVRRASLVVRTVATVGNYDYLYSIRFKPDASIMVETTLAGYMLSTFFDVNGQTVKDAPFGTRVHKHALATLHDHLSGWKVDLDVLGTKNSVRKQSVKVGTWEDALASAQQAGVPAPPWHSGSVIKYIERKQIKKEFGFLIRDPGTVVHSFTNDQFTNSWGQSRGYAIMHGMTARQLLPSSHPFTKAGAWTKYHLAVTKRKEEESLSHAAFYDMVAPAKPITSLDQYINGESIVNEDLVAWVMMGLIHIPRSEDVPLISNSGSQFFIKPWNYYDELVSMDAGNVEAFDSCEPLVGNGYRYEWTLRGQQ